MDIQNQEIIDQLRKMNEQLLANLVNQNRQKRNNRKVKENLKKSQEQLMEALRKQVFPGEN